MKPFIDAYYITFRQFYSVAIVIGESNKTSLDQNRDHVFIWRNLNIVTKCMSCRDLMTFPFSDAADSFYWFVIVAVFRRCLITNQ